MLGWYNNLPPLGQRLADDALLLACAALGLIVLGLIMCGMEDFLGDASPKGWRLLLALMGIGLTAVVPIAVMFACTGLIQRAFGWLGWSFGGEYVVSFGLSLLLVLGGIYGAAVFYPERSAGRRRGRK